MAADNKTVVKVKYVPLDADELSQFMKTSNDEELAKILNVENNSPEFKELVSLIKMPRNEDKLRRAVNSNFGPMIHDLIMGEIEDEGDKREAQ